MKKHSLVRTIYLYIFAMLGLVLLTIGGVRFVNMGLKAWIFTQADQEQKLSYLKPPLEYPLLQIKQLSSQKDLSSEEKVQIKQWLADYQAWKEQRGNVDPLKAHRQRDISFNLALILIGTPLYLYHWRVIKKETKEKD